MMKFLGADGKPLKCAKPKRAEPQGEPVIETTHAENLAARKFLGFLLDDIRYQLKMMAKDPSTSRETFESSKDAALLLSNYLVQQIKELDRLIASVPEQQANEDLIQHRLAERDAEEAELATRQPASAAIN